jgi:hypothetical protein
VSSSIRDPLLRISGRLRDLPSAVGITGYGVWEPYVWQNKGADQFGVRLTPDKAPWRYLMNALDEAGRALSPEPVSILDEANAIVACCWRYGSFLHVLTGGELYPPFRSDASLSRLSDAEMQRINLEFSSGLAVWLTARTADPSAYNRRVRAAHQLLPMPWQVGRPPWLVDALVEEGRRLAGRLVERIGDLRMGTLGSEPATIRHQANYLVLSTYRNGPIENCHAGDWSHGREIPGFLRLYPGDVVRSGRHTAERLAHALVIHDDVRLRDVLPHVWTALGPSGWSLDDETSTIDYPGMPGAGDIQPRLRWLAARVDPLYGPGLDH